MITRRLGIDEAGRGCVLGSLYVGAFLVEGTDDAVLRAAGADDSKALTHPKRVEARKKLHGLGKADYVAIDAPTIDGGNLNALEEDAIVAFVNEYKPDEVYVDALGHPRTLPAVTKRLAKRCPKRIRWVMEPKADSTYAVVGAASIFAKVARDEALHDLYGEFGALGSGYPSDPATKGWLSAWSQSGKPWPSFVRTRWETIRALSQVPLL